MSTEVADPIVAGCEALKKLADHLAKQMGDEMVEAESPTEQLLARQSVLVVRQVHAIVFLVGQPYYAEQAGQLVRGLVEFTRIILWIVDPEDATERFERTVIFWKDGVAQTRSKYEYQRSHDSDPLPEKWEELTRQDKLITEQEAKLGRTIGGLPDARAMWEGLGREDLYGLFRWESDPAHGSAVTLGTVVRSSTNEHFDLGGPNQPRDRARRLGAALALLQLAGAAIVTALRRDEEAWQSASGETEAEMEALLMPLLGEGVE